MKQFIIIERANGDIIINKRFIVSIQEHRTSPGPRNYSLVMKDETGMNISRQEALEIANSVD